MRPFFQWRGGKSWLWNDIKSELIEGLKHHDTYIEPCLGGGAIAIQLLDYCKQNNIKRKFILNDANERMMDAYRYVQTDVDGLIRRLHELDETYQGSRRRFIERRDQMNQMESCLERAALFIWVAANVWRGVYRINKKGHMNVGPDDHPRVHCFDEANMRQLHELFQDVDFRCGSFDDIKEDGLIYLDPPYEATIKEYTTKDPTQDQVNAYINTHKPSTILISNSTSYTPPDNAERLLLTSLYHHYQRKHKQGEVVYKIPYNKWRADQLSGVRDNTLQP